VRELHGMCNWIGAALIWQWTRAKWVERASNGGAREPLYRYPGSNPDPCLSTLKFQPLILTSGRVSTCGRLRTTWRLWRRTPR
jgi:hypothetical protein